MKKVPAQNSDFPFISNSKHIYNKLIDLSIGSVNVGYDTFIVELHANLKDHNEKLDGVTEFDTRTIKLEMSLCHEDAKETLMHEIMHCVLAAIGLEERNFDGEAVYTTNELLASTITKGLQTVHNLNPKLMRLIYE
jgi:hypothetical protein